MTYRIRYTDFWPGFEPSKFLFTEILQSITESRIEVIEDKNGKVDLEIFSCFSFKSSTEKLRKRLIGEIFPSPMQDYVARATFGYRQNREGYPHKTIWYTGENLRPPVGIFSGTLSFDPTDGALNNLYFPFWMTKLNWNAESIDSSNRISSTILHQQRIYEKRPLNVCTFSSNSVPERNRILKAVLASNFVEFEGFGKQYNNVVKSKFESSKNFGFQVCNENDLYPGYVTEKLQEAWISRNIPIWSGLHSAGLFNPDAYLDVSSLTVVEIIDKLNSLTQDEIVFMQTSPLLLHAPSLNSLRKFFEGIVFSRT